MKRTLRGMRVLITAGPTWVPIDKVRVISNLASGRTGILLAERLRRLGAEVTLILGPVENACPNKKIKLIRFRFFNELKQKALEELKSGKYDALIHSAAVSDYRPRRVYGRKISSGIKNLTLRLEPAPKIIDLFRKADESIFLAGFKFEPGAKRNTLIREARALMRSSRLDLVVANTVSADKYSAYIIDESNIGGQFLSRQALAAGLAGYLYCRLAGGKASYFII